jgi:hypothetical protein
LFFHSWPLLFTAAFNGLFILLLSPSPPTSRRLQRYECPHLSSLRCHSFCWIWSIKSSLYLVVLPYSRTVGLEMAMGSRICHHKMCLFVLRIILSKMDLIKTKNIESRYKRALWPSVFLPKCRKLKTPRRRCSFYTRKK